MIRNTIFFIFILVSPYRILGQNDSLTINTTYNENAPALSADGKTMIFQSNRDGSDKLYETLFQNNGKWSEPKPLDEINASDKSFVSIGGPSLTYDGNYLFFCARTKSDANNMDIYVSKKIDNKFSNPTLIGSPINSQAYEGYPSISADGNKLFFTQIAKENSNGNHCFKIMFSEKSEAGLWNTPLPVSRDINAGCPKSPRILSDGKTLLYCSKSDRGKNNFDLYRSVLSKDGIWGDPIPFEFANSIESEEFGTISEVNEILYYVTQGNIYATGTPSHIILNKVVITTLDATDKKALKTSVAIKDSLAPTVVISNDSSNAEGIYQTTLVPGKKYLLELSARGYASQIIAIAFMPNEDFTQINKTIELKIKKRKVILNIPELASTHGMLVDIKITDLGMNEEMLLNENLGRDGKHALNLREGNTFNIEVNTKETPKRTFIVKVEVPEGDSPDGSDIFVSLTSTPVILPSYVPPVAKEPIENKANVKKETITVLKNILFEFKSHQLIDSSLLNLNSLLILLNENSKIHIEIHAHTDDIGSAEFNQTLSEQRAESIVTYLVSKGISPARLKAVGHGKNNPAVSNTNEEGRAKNRRAEFKIINVN